MTTPATPDTCGQGLAAHAVLPSSIAEVLASMAAVLDDHRDAVDVTDPAARPEHDVYLALVGELTQSAAMLTAVATRMTGARDLPMGRHDMARMSSPEAGDRFVRFVTAERALLALLQASVAEGEAMLQEMSPPTP